MGVRVRHLLGSDLSTDERRECLRCRGTPKFLFRGGSKFYRSPLHPPPFTTIILAPFTLFPFSTAAKLFFVFNLGATVLATWISTQLLMTDTKRCVVSVVPAAFLPTLLPILFGQTSTIVMTSVYAGTLLARRGRWGSAGTLLSFALLKPHLWSMTGLYLLLRCPKNKRLSFLLGGLTVVALLVMVVLICAPSSFSQWLSANPDPLKWVGASPMGWIRRIFGTPQTPYPVWPLFVSTLVAPVLTLWIAYRQKEPGIQVQAISLTLCLSCIFSPYLFFFDECVLLLVAIYLASSIDSFLHDRIAKASAFLFFIAPWVLYILNLWVTESGIVAVLGLIALLYCAKGADSAENTNSLNSEAG